MAKDKKVNIKLEVVRDSSSGNLSILAHFDSKAPNVRIDKNEYIWMPTLEERDLINDAFQFLPSNSMSLHSEVKETKIKEPVIPEKTPDEEPLPETISAEESLPETIPPKKIEEDPEGLPPLEKEEPAVFEVTDEDIPPKEDPIPQEEPPVAQEEPPIPPEEPKKDDEMDAKVDIKPGEETTDEEKTGEDKKEEDEGIIVEADADAIEAALKKHVGKDDKDNSIVEADEQTIIDKVLSQKKKGKWSRK